MAGLDIEKYGPKITKVLEKYLGSGYILFLFGSYAKGRVDRLSDIDLAVYRHEPISSKGGFMGGRDKLQRVFERFMIL